MGYVLHAMVIVGCRAPEFTGIESGLIVEPLRFAFQSGCLEGYHLIRQRKRKGATGFDGDHEARVACRAPGTRKSPETITANHELALAA